MSKLFVGPPPARRLYWRHTNGRTTDALPTKSGKLPDVVLDYLEKYLPSVDTEQRKYIQEDEDFLAWTRLHPDSKEWKTFVAVSKIISTVCAIKLEIFRHSHFAKDLRLDVLDFLDVAFEIDTVFGITLPRVRWITDTHWAEVPEESFKIGALCHIVDILVAAKA